MQILGGTANYPAELVSPILGATGPNCKLQFTYRHQLNEGSQLFVKLNKVDPGQNWQRTLTTIQDFKEWNTYTVPIGELGPGYQIVFIGNASNNVNIWPYIDMELDEIKFVNCDATVTNTTTPANLTCDFEDGTCGWFDFGLKSNSKLDWVSS